MQKYENTPEQTPERAHENAGRRADEVTPWMEAFVNARKWVEAHKH